MALEFKAFRWVEVGSGITVVRRVMEFLWFCLFEINSMFKLFSVYITNLDSKNIFVTTKTCLKKMYLEKIFVLNKNDLKKLSISKN